MARQSLGKRVEVAAVNGRGDVLAGERAELEAVAGAGADLAASGRNVDHIALKVRAFDPKAIQAHLSDHGIEAGEVATRFGSEGDGPSMYLTDPEGNGVELKGV